jgi:hypothetical protein
MVSILLAAARVPSRYLEMGISLGANPDMCPGGWNGECSNAHQDLCVANRLAIRGKVAKTFPCSQPSYTRLRITDVTQTGILGCLAHSHLGLAAHWQGEPINSKTERKSYSQ